MAVLLTWPKVLTLVDVCTSGGVIRIDPESWQMANAGVGAVCVDTSLLAASVLHLTLVHVQASSAVGSQLVALIAATGVTVSGQLADAVGLTKAL